MHKKINMFDAVASENRHKLNWKAVLFAAFILFVVFINSMTILWVVSTSTAQTQEMTALQSFLSSDAAQKAKADYEQSVLEIKKLEQSIEVSRALDTYLMSEQDFSKELYYKIEAVKPQGVTILSCVYADGVVSINCKTANDNPPADFTRAIEDMDIFSEVTYLGFTSDSESAVLFPIVCKLKGVEAND